MKIALIADPHVSLLDMTHCGMTLGSNTAVTRAVAADVTRRQPDMVIWMGDLTHEGTGEVRRCFADLYTQLGVPSLAFLGNHDVEHTDKAGFSRETVLCGRRMWWHMAGRNVVLLDTVRELSPDDPSGILSASEVRFLRDVADESSGPMLVMEHHPLRAPPPEALPPIPLSSRTTSGWTRPCVSRSGSPPCSALGRVTWTSRRSRPGSTGRGTTGRTVSRR